MTIKKGDLVMVVRPRKCCGNSSGLGRIFTLIEITREPLMCAYCGHIDDVAVACLSGDVYGDAANLKKIDPPADGDSLPTRADIEVAA